MDESKLTPADKEELLADLKEVLTAFLGDVERTMKKKTKEMVDELAEKIEKC